MQDDAASCMGLPLYGVVLSRPRMSWYHPAVLNPCDHPEGWLAILYEVAGFLDSVPRFGLCASVPYPLLYLIDLRIVPFRVRADVPICL